MASCSSCNIPDAWAWIQSLPPIAEWRTNSMSACICSSPSPSFQPSLNLVVSKTSIPRPPTFLTFSIIADFKLPFPLWASKPFKLGSKSAKPSDVQLLPNLIESVILYGSPNNNSSLRIKVPKLEFISTPDFKEIFNLTFLTLALLVCVYESPTDLRSRCLDSVKNQLASSASREASKLLMRLVGSNLEEMWMRSLNLAITNWIWELQSARHCFRALSPLFSYAVSTAGLWKVQLYCPVIAMDVQSSSGSVDDRLLFSLRYHQLQGVVQFNYRVVARESWVEINVNTDNIRCDVTRLVSEDLLSTQGAGSGEKHFPSRVSLQLTPMTLQSDILSVSVGKSSENPTTEIELEKKVDASLEPVSGNFGVTVGASETVTTALRPWRFEESVNGGSANLNWFLHDSVDGREVLSSKPSRMSLIHPRGRFRDRYASARRPFTKRGGVVFAGDEYGKGVRWTVDRGAAAAAAAGRVIEWEVRGWIWVTYWPNKHRTSYNETRRLEFRECVSLAL